MNIAPRADDFLKRYDLFIIYVDEIEFLKWRTYFKCIEGAARNKCASCPRNICSASRKSVYVDMRKGWTSLIGQNLRICRRVFPNNFKFDLRPYSYFIVDRNFLPRPFSVTQNTVLANLPS